MTKKSVISAYKRKEKATGILSRNIIRGSADFRHGSTDHALAGAKRAVMRKRCPNLGDDEVSARVREEIATYGAGRDG